MIELYHHGSSVCAAKVRLCLAEKQLPWESRYIDILKGQQFTDEYMRINKRAVVPTLVHDGAVICDSTVICEYIEDVFPSQPLRPGNALAHARALKWTKAVDEDLHPACAALTFAASHRFTVLRLGPEGVTKFLESTPRRSVTPQWHDEKRSIVLDGFSAPGVANKVKLYYLHLELMEDDLRESTWLAGEEFSMADIAMIPYVTRLDMLSMDRLWSKGRLPKVEDWYARARARHSFSPSLLDWIPDDLRKDLAENGKRSWSDVARILDL
jgi:glutathione S-transferase